MQSFYQKHGPYELLARICHKSMGVECPFDYCRCCPFEDEMNECDEFEDEPHCLNCNSQDWRSFFED